MGVWDGIRRLDAEAMGGGRLPTNRFDRWFIRRPPVGAAVSAAPWLVGMPIVLRARPVAGIAMAIVAAGFTAFVTFNRLTVQKLRIEAETDPAREV